MPGDTGILLTCLAYWFLILRIIPLVVIALTA